MRSVINNNLFRHTSSSSANLNNLCTLVHKLQTEGIYRGEVFINEQFLGSFKVNYDPKIEISQLTIDMSAFDPFHKTTGEKRDFKTVLQVGMEGYLVLFISGHQNGMYIKLKRLTEKKEEDYFDSRMLGTGDMVIFRTIYPGMYTITDSVSSGAITFSIIENKEGKYTHPSKVQPLSMTLSAKGFDLKKMEVLPLQAIIINSETKCSLKLELKKEKEKTRKTK